MRFPKRRAAVLLLTALMPALASAQKDGPDWVQQGSDYKDGEFLGVGTGNSRTEAVAVALAELAKIKESIRQSKAAKPTGSGPEVPVSQGYKSKVDASFGAVSVRQETRESMETTVTAARPAKAQEKPTDPSKVKDYLKANAERAFDDLASGKDDIQTKAQGIQNLRMVLHISMKKGKGSFLVNMDSASRMDLEHPEGGHDHWTVEVDADGLGLNDLLSELKSLGIDARYWQDPADGSQFVGLRMKAP